MKIVFAIGDSTSYTPLKPVIDRLSTEHEIEIVTFDSFYETAKEDRDVSLPKDDFDHNHIELAKYIRHALFDTTPSTWSTPRRIGQRLVFDNLSPKIGYETDRFIADRNFDVLVTTADQVPFIRHIIRKIHDTDKRSVVVQHGIYEYALDPANLESRFLFPNFHQQLPIVERLKRRLGFKYGVSQYTHPFADVQTTIGTFFSNQIGLFRSEYPNFGETEIQLTGSPEFNSTVFPYTPETDSILFLSQQKYESGMWSKDQQEQLFSTLSTIDKQIPTTIRPHPKDSDEKINRLQDIFAVSSGESLASDVAAHDIILTVNSTALFEGIIQGKVCGCLELPSATSTFPPVTHNHILQVTPGTTDFAEKAASRSEATQTEYLNKFCYMPSLDPDTDYQSSVEALAAAIVGC